jgi:hypothetical protein
MLVQMDPQEGRPEFIRNKLQMISINLFNIAYIDSLYTEGCVHNKVKCNRRILFSFHVRWAPYHHCMARPSAADIEGSCKYIE